MKASIKVALVLCMAGSVGGCDAAAQLAVGGALVLFGVGAAAISEGVKNSTSYCVQSSGQVYTRPGDCATGDREVDSTEYQRLYKQHADEETQRKITANDAARSAKTYCVAGISGTPYTAMSGKCRDNDQTISENEYQGRKSDQAKNLSAPPSAPIADQKPKTDTPPMLTADASSVGRAPEVGSEKPTPASANLDSPTPSPEPTIVTPTAQSQLPIIPGNAKPVGSGTAFFIADHGRLLTNHHVIEGCDWIGIFGQSGIHPAVALADNADLDLAVLQTDFDGEVTAVFADKTPDIGDDSYIDGYPLLDTLWSLNFTNGMVSSQSPLGLPELLQTTAAVQPGNSGGPMFDSSGRVIGVVVARLKDQTAQNVNFAIKGTVASQFINNAGVTPRVTGRSKEIKPNLIAKSAKAMVFPALCFKKP
jgi:S1-C subfamily serine protease